MGFFPRFTARGRALWVLAATGAGAVGILVAWLRGDRTAAVIIAVALAALVGVWMWGGADDADGPQPRE